VYLSFGLPILFILWGLTYAFHTWPVYQAQIVGNEIVPAKSAKGKQGYEVHLRAAFVIDGKPTTSDIILWNDSYADARRQAAAFPVGSGQAVHYDPRMVHPHPVMVSMENQGRQQFHKAAAALVVPLVGGPIAGLLGIYFFFSARASKRVLAATA
jgi:hypothetical protein